jgi:glycosyltransferase involved in cell wall biosynthesis
MKLLAYAPQMAAYGGMERHVCAVAAAAAQRGHTVLLLTTSNSLGPELRAELAEGGVVLRELPIARSAAAKATKLFWLLRQTLSLRREGWDIVYTNGQSGLAPLLWAAGRRGARRIHHHHTAADAGEQATWSASARRTLRRAPELVGCSRATCAALAAALPRRDARFLPYLTREPVQADAVRALRPAEPGRPLRFGFLGRLVREKGIDALARLSAHPALADVTWAVHGAGPDYPPDWFKQYPNIHYHGAYTGAKEHAAALLGLDALALFSTHNEGMPLSLIEGLSAGLPWIATERGGTREIALSPADAELVAHPASDEALVAGVSALAQRIRSGATSRLRQRAAYDEAFAPGVVTARWMDYFFPKT